MNCIHCAKYKFENYMTELRFLEGGKWYCPYCHTVFYYKGIKGD